MNKKILVAIAWPYVNGDIHVGHLAGYLLPADIFARYHRLIGNDVLMVSGSDCHGTPITVEADKQGLKPQEIVDLYHPKDIELFNKYNLSYNLYTSTTTKIHKKVVQDFFIDLLEQDYIVKDIMKQYYSEKEKKFLPDRYVEGICPHCNAKEQRSDQCENCGRWLEDGELIQPVSKITGSAVVLKNTEHYFLDFTKLNEKLKDYVNSKKEVWRNWIFNESNGWLKEGLRKRAITRDMDWSIELPVEEIKKLDKSKQLDNFEGKKIYVWFEAVIGYLSAAQEWSVAQFEKENTIFRKDKDQSSDWKDWWLNKDAEHYYFMGQDNLVFHTLMWPGQLIGSSSDYNLPNNIFVNKFMNYDGKKFSKSRNWTIDSNKIAEEYGVDLVRYYIASNLPENKEANFTWEAFVDSVNNELVANLGNLINRTLKFLESRFNGEIKINDFEIDEDLKKEIIHTYERVGNLMEKGEIVSSLNTIFKLASIGNKYFDENQIWHVINTDKQNAEYILTNLLNLILNISILINPFLPESSNKALELLGEPILKPEINKNIWKIKLKSQFKLTQKVEPLFTKLDKENVLAKEKRKGKQKIKEEVISHIPGADIAFKIIDYPKLDKNAVAKYIDAELNHFKKKSIDNFVNSKIIKGYEEIHKKYDIWEDTSSLQLAKLIYENKFPKVNPLIDLYNISSLETEFAFGLNDADKINFPVEIVQLQKDTAFIPLAKKESKIIKKGQYSAIDRAGKIICYAEIKQSDHCKVTNKSKRILVYVQGNERSKPAEVKHALNHFLNLITRFSKIKQK